MTRSYNVRNLQRHNVSTDEIVEVLRSPLTLTLELPPSNRGNYRVMWIGFTLNLRRLEIGIEYLPGDHDHAFHAMDATEESGKEFTRYIRL